MNEEEILKEITEREWADERMTIRAKPVISPEKLAAFLAKHLPSPNAKI